MQPYQSSRVDLVELRTQIVKKVGVERSKKYFYYLNRFLSQKLSKSEFDKSCFRFLGRENLPLHNNLICSILKNACQAKTPPPNYEAGPTKSLIQASKDSPIREDGHEQIGSLIPNQSMPIRSNGILPVSPRKVRSVTQDNGSKFAVENGELAPCDYQRPVQHLPTVAEQPENEREGSAQWPIERPKTQKDQTAFVEDRDEVEQAHHLSFSRSPLLAPLGIPYCSASMGGARKAMPVTSSGDFVSYYDSGGLSGTEMLRKRMEQIADVQGLGGVTTECANTLNKMLDVYLKRLIKSCVELVGAQSPCGPRKSTVQKAAEAIDAPSSVSCCQDEPDGSPFVEARLLQDEICGLSIQMAVFSCRRSCMDQEIILQLPNQGKFQIECPRFVALLYDKHCYWLSAAVTTDPKLFCIIYSQQ
ncbi:hypothetical protein OIU84_009736 [Salix udensis]|uniref:Transcriptional coactivator Hfi1/Transcriptional adapter 1 n=1 Tax=Salix udensis TaxID=889485 RepID=A0AAD6JL14_9ROSI|nr:hypothetical protein OIU84_009736 [Salix udensis]